MSAAAAAGFVRDLPLEGGFNLRDFGGYATADGGRVKTGLLFRSGQMSLLTPDDEAHLAGLGIKVVCDLRRGTEREAHPTRWCAAAAGTEYWARDYNQISGVLDEVLKSTAPTAQAMRAAMLQLYREIPTDHAPSYRWMFERLLAGDVPLLFNCAAGKDRTGVAAALVLHVLRVPYDVIVEDYLLTNRADFRRLIGPRAINSTRITDEVRATLLAADADYLAQAWDELDRSFGGVDGYLASELGVNAAAQDALRRLLVD